VDSSGANWNCCEREDTINLSVFVTLNHSPDEEEKSEEGKIEREGGEGTGCLAPGPRTLTYAGRRL